MKKLCVLQAVLEAAEAACARDSGGDKPRAVGAIALGLVIIAFVISC